MEFNFIKKENKDASVTIEYIQEVEKKFDIEFPQILKDYFIQHNGADIKECRFKKFGLEFCVMIIMDLGFGDLCLEKMVPYSRTIEELPESFVPLALDEEEDYYYWDKKDGKVYYVSFENIEHLKEIFESVEEFFEILNACCNQLQDEASMEERKLEESEILVTEKSKRKGFLFWKR